SASHARPAAGGRLRGPRFALLWRGPPASGGAPEEESAAPLPSRDIRRGPRLSDAGRSSLRDIVDRVELTHFGQRPAALADYVACRTSFNALTQALHGGASA